MVIFQRKIFFFEKIQKPYLDRTIGNDMYAFQCFNDSDTLVKHHGRQTGIAKNLDTF